MFSWFAFVTYYCTVPTSMEYSNHMLLQTFPMHFLRSRYVHSNPLTCISRNASTVIRCYIVRLGKCILLLLLEEHSFRDTDVCMIIGHWWCWIWEKSKWTFENCHASHYLHFWTHLTPIYLSLKNSLIIHDLTAYQNTDKMSRVWALYPDKTLLVSILYIKNTNKA